MDVSNGLYSSLACAKWSYGISDERKSTSASSHFQRFDDLVGYYLLEKTKTRSSTADRERSFRYKSCDGTETQISRPYPCSRASDFIENVKTAILRRIRRFPLLITPYQGATVRPRRKACLVPASKRSWRKKISAQDGPSSSLENSAEPS